MLGSFLPKKFYGIPHTLKIDVKIIVNKTFILKVVYNLKIICTH